MPGDKCSPLLKQLSASAGEQISSCSERIKLKSQRMGKILPGFQLSSCPPGRMRRKIPGSVLLQTNLQKAH